jgi:hypothetical protein
MADTAKTYSTGLLGFFKGDCKWLTSGGSTFKVALLTSAYTVNQDTDNFWDEISTHEVASSGDYSAGGAALTTTDPTLDAASNEIRFAADATIVFTGVTWADVKHYVVYWASGTASTARLICYQTFETTQVATAGTFTITFGATGIFKDTAS